MKVYTKVVIDIDTGEVLEEESYEYEGEVALCWGGGGATGVTEHPPYIKNAFKYLWSSSWLSDDKPIAVDRSIVHILNTMTSLEGNPFYNVDTQDVEKPYDPNENITYNAESPLGQSNLALMDFASANDLTAQLTDWDSIKDSILSELSSEIPEEDIPSRVASIVLAELGDASSVLQQAVTSAISAMDSAPIDSAIESFENEALPEHMRRVASFSAGMAKIGAVNSSAFVLGLGMLESDFSKQVEAVRAKLKLETFSRGLQDYVATFVDLVKSHIAAYLQNHLSTLQLRFNTLIQSISQVANFYAMDAQRRKDVAALQYEISRMVIVSMKEKVDKQLQLYESYAKWDLDSSIHAASVIASSAGGVAGPRPPEVTPVQSALGGALSGAATGAMLGAQVGHPVAGAIAGGITGLIGNFLGG